ncbi:hypothetical protein Scep_017665 [Stephania cephalantha]|uniref:Secreted protein n=1 Tax=Stephania cephalantha TaxID=152367 RepID=A0AAP0NTS3_9MAGN
MIQSSLSRLIGILLINFASCSRNRSSISSTSHSIRMGIIRSTTFISSSPFVKLVTTLKFWSSLNHG